MLSLASISFLWRALHIIAQGCSSQIGNHLQKNTFLHVIGYTVYTLLRHCDIMNATCLFFLEEYFRGFKIYSANEVERLA